MLRGGEGVPDSLDGVTAANPETAAPAAHGRRSAPGARVSRGTVAANIAVALAGRNGSGPLLGEARADAWGHGAADTIAALHAAGVREVRVDASAIAALTDAGCTGLTVSGEPNVDPLTVFGLPGGDPASRPALRLTGRVLSTKALLRGEGVSYGYLHRAAADTRIALVTGGYAQGISRGLGGRACGRDRRSTAPDRRAGWRWTSASSTSALRTSRAARRRCSSAIRKRASRVSPTG